AVGADCLLMLPRHQRICLYPTALLGLIVDRDDGCTVLVGYPRWCLDRMSAVGLNHRLITTDKQAPDQEGSNGGSKHCAKQPSTGAARAGPSLFFIHLDPRRPYRATWR